jgi:hypothetical protein
MEYYGRTLQEAIHNTAHRKREVEEKNWQLDRYFKIAAPSGYWGDWKEIWAVIGGDTPIRINVKYSTLSEIPSNFDVQIRSGSTFIQKIGSGSTLVEIAPNVATAIHIRAKSHSNFPQDVRVHVASV